MKKLITVVLALVCVMGLMACSAQERGEKTGEVPQQIQLPENNGTSQETNVLKEPSALTVIDGENNSIEALRGTTSWKYQNEDGTWAGFEADSIHPLEAKEYMPCLKLLPVISSSGSHLKVTMQWDAAPDKTSVRCWNEKDWGQPDAESEELQVCTLLVDSNVETAPITSVELKDGNYIYEVIAEWNSHEEYNGIARYSFYTVK